VTKFDTLLLTKSSNHGGGFAARKESVKIILFNQVKLIFAGVL